MKKFNYYIVFILALILAQTTKAQNISAKEIIEKSFSGADVIYKNVTISGPLDFTPYLEKKDDLPSKSWFGTSGNNIEKRIKGKVEFINCVFESDVLAYIHDDKTEYTFVAHFDQEVTFKNCQFKKNIAFKYSEFNGKVNFSGSLISGEANFKYAEFDQYTDFSKITFDQLANFKYAEYENMVSYANTTFDDEANFKYAEMDEGADFSNSIFNGLLNFKYTQMEGTVLLKNFQVNGTLDTKYTEVNGHDFTSYLQQSN